MSPELMHTFDREEYETQEQWLDALADNAAELDEMEREILEPSEAMEYSCTRCGREVSAATADDNGGMCECCAAS